MVRQLGFKRRLEYLKINSEVTFFQPKSYRRDLLPMCFISVIFDNDPWTLVPKSSTTEKIIFWENRLGTSVFQWRLHCRTSDRGLKSLLLVLLTDVLQLRLHQFSRQQYGW
ncbi:hypothetical protein ACROYT_G022207 [Oculina patagonica]